MQRQSTSLKKVRTLLSALQEWAEHSRAEKRFKSDTILP